MKNKIIKFLLIIIGIALIFYPIISNLVLSYNQTVAISNYQKGVKILTDEQKKIELEKATEYNNMLEKESIIDISLEEKENKEYISYLNVLNIGEVIGYIEIPKIDVYLPIYHGLSENVLQSGVGHLESSSLPVGGKGTHAVLAAHTGLTRRKMFDDIDKLGLKDKFYIYVLDEILAYEIDKIDVVEPDDTEAIKIDDENDFITLVTCTPYMINTHRLLVRGKRVEFKGNEKDIGKTRIVSIENIQSTQKKNIVIAIVTAILVSLILIITFIIKNSKKERKPRRRKKCKRSLK